MWKMCLGAVVVSLALASVSRADVITDQPATAIWSHYCNNYPGSRESETTTG